MTRAVIFFFAFTLLTIAAFAHHGWGSYDANKPLTVTGPILTSKFENPHATITVQGQRQGLDGNARAHLAYEQSWSDGKDRRRRPKHLGLRLSVDS
jgi:hypothetical protein